MEAPDQEITPLSEAEREVLSAIRSLEFGTIEIIVHRGKVKEIRQTRRTRIEE
jgi:hypothetical protein